MTLSAQRDDVVERCPKRRRDPSDMRECRARQREGRAIYRVEVNQHDLAKALVVARELTEEETADPKLVKRTLEKMVAEWIDRFKNSKRWADLWGDDVTA
jgi:hypothetical protein